VTEWGRPWTPDRDREDEPNARYRPRRPLVDILEEVRALVAQAAVPPAEASGRLILVGSAGEASDVLVDAADALRQLEHRVAAGQYPVAVLLLAFRENVELNVRITLLSDFADDEPLEKGLFTFGAALKRGLSIGPDGRPVLNLSDPDADESAP
jgi:hypothetical protein